MLYRTSFSLFTAASKGIAGALLLSLLCFPALAQRGQRTLLNGNLHPKALPQYDQGAVDPAMEIPSLSLELKQTTEQQAAFDKLLAEQQDPSSPNYHRWLTPEEYADRFGASLEDIGKATAWLQQQNLTVLSVARARNRISFKGTAGNVGAALGTEIHRYQVNGESHFANSTEPSIPADLNFVVRGVRGLNDFKFKPKRVSARALDPNYTSSRGNHYISPNDLATIYNINPLYNSGVNGAGQKLVIVGQTQVTLSDLQQFRTFTGLPASDPQTVLVPNLRDPGISSDDLVEADLDIEWAGAVARNASIIYVYSFDVIDALQYAIDQNLAPVLSMSYGLCEPETAPSDAATMRSWAKQANSQGMTWFAASGDSGGADCASGSSSSAAGLSVDIPPSIPEVTAVGGTEFNEGATAASFWNAVNDANQASVLSYIPEVAWNDSALDGSPSATGGGASVYFVKPSWQTGSGVPNDGARDVPDISLSASADHDGFLIFSNGSLQVVGGTSVSSPSFAGIAALLNHRLVSSGAQQSPGLGNMNPKLYSLAQTTPSAFHDITGGSNIVTVTCGARARNCVSGSFGYNAGPGYDQATGLGSVDAAQLINAWTGTTGSVSRGTANMTVTTTSASIASSQNVTLTATVGGGGTTPTGSVSFTFGSFLVGTGTLVAGSGGTAIATVIVSGAQLNVGSDNITAQYSGDTAYNPATASIVITVTGPTSAAPSIAAMVNSASYKAVYAPGMVMSIFGAGLAPSTWTAQTIPLPTSLAGVSVTVNGVTAPLYYVSPGLLNVQIPYEITPNTFALVTVTNNGQSASATFPASSAGPGIFADQTGALVPAKTASRGQTIALYTTGEGAVTPAVPTGTAPASGTPLANLPKPLQTVGVTVAGIPAAVQFIGITPGLVGVVQINFTIPSSVPTGNQAVAVVVNGVASAPVTLTVQ